MQGLGGQGWASFYVTHETEEGPLNEGTHPTTSLPGILPTAWGGWGVGVEALEVGVEGGGGAVLTVQCLFQAM